MNESIVKEMTDFGNVLGDAFTGTVIEVPTPATDGFFLKNKELFAESGTASFLRALNIPGSFFQKQTESLKKDILMAQKGDVRAKAKSLLFLVKDGVVVSVGPKGKMGWEDPSKVLGLDEKYFVRRFDFQRNVFQYTNVTKELGYRPAVFVNVPIFYAGRLTMDVGLFKVLCTNGMVDNVNTTTVKMAEDMDPMLFTSVLKALNEAVASSPNYTVMVKGLESIKLPDESGMPEFLDKLHITKVVPKTLVKLVERHINSIRGEEVVETNSPKEVKTYFDMMEALTFYAQRLGSLGSQRRAEAGIYKFMLDEFHVRNPGISAPILNDYPVRSLLAVKAEAVDPEML